MIVYGVTTKGNGDAFINQGIHTTLGGGGGQAGQGYPCVLVSYGAEDTAKEDGKTGVAYRKSRRASSKEDFETWESADVANTLNTNEFSVTRTTMCVVQEK